ncbi:MAG: hypothetical protein IPM63_07165 [Acidobacteriota bacterium]|nr:MAG: hypothetical protein IPM63_07165 [Acidobacteriota bacterium]
MRQRKLLQCKKAFLAAILFLLALNAFPQELPDKIRGYRVHKAEIGTASGNGAEDGRDAFEMSFSDPEFDSVGLEGVTFTVDPVLTVKGRSGRVDFLSFENFEVNGIPVEIRDYESPFDFKSGETVALEDPVRIVVGLTSAVKGAAKEIKSSKDEWLVSGTVFVFGRFKWSIFRFKRVVPIPVSFTIPNPLKDRQES